MLEQVWSGVLCHGKVTILDNQDWVLGAQVSERNIKLSV